MASQPATDVVSPNPKGRRQMSKFFLMPAIAIASMAATPATTVSGNAGDAKPAVQIAQDTPAANRSSSQPLVQAPAAEQKKTCRLLPSSYSRRSDRVCLTKAEWAQVDKDLEN